MSKSNPFSSLSFGQDFSGLSLDFSGLSGLDFGLKPIDLNSPQSLTINAPLSQADLLASINPRVT